MILINGLNGPVIPLQNDVSELVTSPGREAAIALSDMGRQTLDPLIDALAADSWVARMHTALALGLIEDGRAVEPLMARLGDEVPKVRERVAWALGMIEDPRASDALVDAMKDENADVREQAIWAIGRIH